VKHETETASGSSGGLGRIAAIMGRARLALHLRLAASRWHGASFTGLPPGTRQLALTYDDGPNEPYTSQLLEVLENHGARATFFLIGQFVTARPAIARSLVEAGHAVGNHTYTHPDLTALSRAELERELQTASRAIEDATGTRPTLFRPPFGRRSRRILAVVRAQGMTPVMWRAACYDWKATSAQSIVNTLVAHIRGGEVIQLHDGSHRKLGVDRSHCLKATDEILRHYREAGYEFVTVPEMMAHAARAEAVAGAALGDAPRPFASTAEANRATDDAP
jgi:peptidoglycan/xylan/chitin deacetylase (PgdA/CDA1 family)